MEALDGRLGGDAREHRPGLVGTADVCQQLGPEGDVHRRLRFGEPSLHGRLAARHRAAADALEPRDRRPADPVIASDARRASDGIVTSSSWVASRTPTAISATWTTIGSSCPKSVTDSVTTRLRTKPGPRCRTGAPHEAGGQAAGRREPGRPAGANGSGSGTGSASRASTRPIASGVRPDQEARHRRERGKTSPAAARRRRRRTAGSTARPSPRRTSRQGDAGGAPLRGRSTSRDRMEQRRGGTERRVDRRPRLSRPTARVSLRPQEPPQAQAISAAVHGSTARPGTAPGDVGDERDRVRRHRRKGAAGKGVDSIVDGRYPSDWPGPPLVGTIGAWSGE